MKEKCMLVLILKWLNRFLCTISLLTLGIILLVFTFSYINNFKDGNDMAKILPVIMTMHTILLTAIAGGLAVQGSKNHKDLNELEAKKV